MKSVLNKYNTRERKSQQDLFSKHKKDDNNLQNRDLHKAGGGCKIYIRSVMGKEVRRCFEFVIVISVS